MHRIEKAGTATVFEERNHERLCGFITCLHLCGTSFSDRVCFTSPADAYATLTAASEYVAPALAAAYTVPDTVIEYVPPSLVGICTALTPVSDYVDRAEATFEISGADGGGEAISFAEVQPGVDSVVPKALT